MEATLAQSWEVTYAGNRRWYVQLLPSLTDFAFLLPVFLLFVMLPGTQVLLNDGDTGWHIRTGDWIWQHQRVPTVDIFSFTKPDQPWFAWEWGWDVLFGIVNRFSGLAGVVFVTVVLLGFVSALLFRLIRRCSHCDALAALFTLLAVCASMIHWLARPHLFSWVFVLVFLHVIASAEKGNFRALHALPLLTLFWTNLHGGFFVGIVLLVTSALAEVLKALLWSENIWHVAYKNSRPYLLAALGCLAASFINPYTWHLHQHIAAYLRDSKLLDNIQEFQSINFHRPSSIFFEAMLLLGVPAAFWCLRRGRIAQALSILLWAHLALVSGRNTPIFVLIAAPWAAAMSLDVARRLEGVRWLKKTSALISEILDEFRPLERIGRWHVVSAAAVLVVAFVLGSNRPGLEAQFNPKSFRLQTIPALETVKGLRVFTSDQWGDYLIYRFYPDQKVFMDGRSDFYGNGMVRTYQHIISAQYDWETDLKRFGIEAVMVKPEEPIAAVLKESRKWKTVFDNGSVIIFRAQPPVSGTNGPCVSAGTGPDARNKLGVFGSSQVHGSNSTLKFQERRSL
jgi:hypothetical protein